MDMVYYNPISTYCVPRTSQRFHTHELHPYLVSRAITHHLSGFGMPLIWHS